MKELLNESVSGVISEISKHDDMYQGNSEHYFSVGNSAFRCIQLAILSANKDLTDIKRILDFPCGYGRVLRVLKAALPSAQITACDLEHKGVDFCESVFGATPVYSNKNLDKVLLVGSYDLIWVGSLFTHLDSTQWPQFLELFSKSLSPGGILVFTTQGRYSAAMIRNGETTYGIETKDKLKTLLVGFENHGFGFSNYFHSVDYGISLSAPSFVLKMLEQQQNLDVVMTLERGWDNHQDVIACIKQ